uniref:NADH-ubiquinone oxidoreductase chain 3 n=1 Tax=Rhopalomyia pomum TaxID=608481 RepID=C7FIL0_RHOPM|nr:NADH dehydrogenase subunit 3 [Rhopalomyia pomum]
MYMILIMSLLFFIISNLLMILSNMMSKKKKINFEKMTPFESGFNMKIYSRVPFSLRFFLITIIFLIFDVEIALLMPLISTMMISNYMNWMIMSFTFMLILMMGLIYEWIQGALNWI